MKAEDLVDKQEHLSKRIAESSSSMEKVIIPPVATTALKNIPTVNIPSMTLDAAIRIPPAITAVQSSLEPLLATQRMIQHMVEPYQIAANLSPALEAIAEQSRRQAELLSSTAVNVMASSIAQLASTFEPPVMNWFNNGITSPILGILDELQSWVPRDFDVHHFNKLYLREMYDARWFPYLGWNADLNLAIEILEIIDKTRKSKNREKQIDKAVLTYYTKKEIEETRKSWRDLGLPSFRLRILNQAVKAYHRKEFALTVSALVSIWEGIIAQKTYEQDDYRISRKTRENLTKLIEANEFDTIFSSYCEEFIFYDCKNPEDVKPDAPGRHEISHSWYDKYPSRKKALNAILFTDFLLKLEPK